MKAQASKRNGSSFKNKSRSVHISQRDCEDDITEEFNIDRLSIFRVGEETSPIMINLQVNKTFISLELDTGAAVSIMPFHIFKKKFPDLKIVDTKVVLRTIKERVFPIGKAIVSASINGKTVDNLELFIITEGNISLLGRSWIKPLGLLQQSTPLPIFSTMKENVNKTRVQKLLEKHSELFSSNLGVLNNCEAHLFIQKGAPPRFFKAKPVPYALQVPIESELNKLQLQGVLTSIQYSEWAAPIVPIIKKDGSIRICGDYKVGLNPVMIIDKYPLPKIEDILSQLAGGTFFTKLDMTQAYQQVKMDEESSKFLTINTHKGLFKVNRLPFGISAAPAMFQKIMDQILSGLPNVICYLDDILVTGLDFESHVINLDKVLQRLEEAGVRLNQKKCEFLKPKVEYLGHIIDAKGVHPSQEKIEAILQAPEPKDANHLRSFLGLVSYYRKFLPNIASTLNPLNALLEKKAKWNWNSLTKEAFASVKEAVTSVSVLTHFDPNLPLTLACDASPTGLGAVISHIFSDKTEHPIAFASRTLSQAERNYSQIDKESLAIIFGLKRFHQFLFGRKFILFTDHKPLTRIFVPDKHIPVLAAARLQRWSLILATYAYTIKFRPSKDNANADALSRFPSPIQEEQLLDQYEDFLINQVESFPLSPKEIASSTSKDRLLTQVFRYTKEGWPNKKVDKELTPFQSRAEEISIQDGCLLWEMRVLIPSCLRPSLLHELHRHHAGMVKMKMLARSFFWWPRLDDDIERLARSCEACALQANNPAKAPSHPWIRPSQPWECLHIDFAGPFMGYNFMVTVDAFSKWPEVSIMKNTTALNTIATLEDYLARFGYPIHIISDNGAQFLSREFKTFCKDRGIHHTLSAPYHPESNGQAERFVQILKKFLKRLNSKDNMRQKIADLLFSYRSTPHTSTKKSPAELFLGREIRTRLHLIHPKTNPKQNILFELPPSSSGLRTFSVGQHVLSRSFNGHTTDKWIRAKIRNRIGPLTYIVDFADGKSGKRHVDQLLPSHLYEEGTNLRHDQDSPSLATTNQPKSDFSVIRHNPRRTKKTPLKLLNHFQSFVKRGIM